MFHWTKRANRTVCVSKREEDEQTFKLATSDTIQAQMRDKLETLTARLAEIELANQVKAQSLRLEQQSFRPFETPSTEAIAATDKV